jgi:hypothetical protein
VNKSFPNISTNRLIPSTIKTELFNMRDLIGGIDRALRADQQFISKVTIENRKMFDDGIEWLGVNSRNFAIGLSDYRFSGLSYVVWSDHHPLDDCPGIRSTPAD